MSNDRPNLDPVIRPDVPTDLSQTSHPLSDAGGLELVNASFPLPPNLDTLNKELLMFHVWNGLPAKSEAIKLVEVFFGQSSMRCEASTKLEEILTHVNRIAPIRRVPFVNGPFTALYDDTDKAGMSIQDVSIVYGVFAIGVHRNFHIIWFLAFSQINRNVKCRQSFCCPSVHQPFSSMLGS
jgi:hypothetical protein